MNRSQIIAIAQKDMRAITSNVQVWLGLVLLPLVFGVLLPGVLILVIKTVNITDGDLVDMVQKVITQLPAGDKKEQIMALPTLNHQIIYIFVNYMLGPFFLLIPVLNSLMIALNSLVGEKERRTLESLLFAPIEVRDLFLGKLAATFIPTFVVTLVSFLLCGIIINGLAYSMFDGLIFPNLNWGLLLLWVAPMFTGLVIQISIFISARSKGFQEAQQIGGIVVLPVVGLAISQVTGVLLLSPQLLLGVGLLLLLVNLFLLRRLTKMNQRHLLFERQVH
ncbi:ABC transporter permease subunit [Paenibacillus sp. HN-1]|uniref:ABC transporter permease subunit n=1 Tax=Paenibacillus TaxID=44249 RepID=UPI001CA9D84C|nr:MULTISPECIES: ABC transporter permease subunit [Paenibacillus]MBY9080228.1 ABC transporter permease subunit [Paenibacillus sp. CGMCC 1.18879]MBY9083113.1 ABC transporter permease subunit [Paenibacillus sinensis]